MTDTTALCAEAERLAAWCMLFAGEESFTGDVARTLRALAAALAEAERRVDEWSIQAGHNANERDAARAEVAAAAWAAFDDVLGWINTQTEQVIDKKDLYKAVMEMRPRTDALAEVRKQARREGIEEALAVVRCAGRPVGAGDGDTFVPGTTIDAERAIRALLEDPSHG